jgi:hypothetical protein
MKKTVLWIAAAILLLAGGVVAYEVAFVRESKADTVICPLTGEEIPRDQCPLCQEGR